MPRGSRDGGVASLSTSEGPTDENREEENLPWPTTGRSSLRSSSSPLRSWQQRVNASFGVMLLGWRLRITGKGTKLF
jgi:hypothetical protein